MIIVIPVQKGVKNKKKETSSAAMCLFIVHKAWTFENNCIEKLVYMLNNRLPKPPSVGFKLSGTLQ